MRQEEFLERLLIKRVEVVLHVDVSWATALNSIDRRNDATYTSDRRFCRYGLLGRLDLCQPRLCRAIIAHGCSTLHRVL